MRASIVWLLLALVPGCGDDSTKGSDGAETREVDDVGGDAEVVPDTTPEETAEETVEETVDDTAEPGEVDDTVDEDTEVIEPAVEHEPGSHLWVVHPLGGGADDGDNLQRALDEATSGPDGGAGAEVRLAPGVFHVRDMIVAPSFRGAIRGAGRGLTRVMAGTADGQPMDLPSAEDAAQCHIVRLPSLFCFPHPTDDALGVDLVLEDLTLEAVPSEGLEGAPDPAIFWGLPWWNRNILSFVALPAKRQPSYPITLDDYLAGEARALVGRTRVAIARVDFVAHLSADGYESHGGARVTNADAAIDLTDWASATQLIADPEGAEPSTPGFYRAPGGPGYDGYIGPDVPRTGGLVIEDSTFRELGTIFVVKHLYSRPAEESSRFFVYDGPAALERSELRLSDSTVIDVGHSPAGASGSTFVLGFPSADTVIEGNTFQRAAGGLTWWLDDNVAGNAWGFEDAFFAANWPIDTSGNPRPRILIRDNVFDVSGVGTTAINVWNYVDFGFFAGSFELAEGLISGNTFTGAGPTLGYVHAGQLAQVNLEDTDQFTVSGNDFSEPHATAIVLATPDDAVCTDNRFAGVLADGCVPPRAPALPRVVATVAGQGVRDGPIAQAWVGRPQFLAELDGDLIFADGASNTIRRIDADGLVTTIAGSWAVGDSGDGGPATAARMALVYGGELVVGDDGVIYVSDFANHKIRAINPNPEPVVACGGVALAGGAIDTIAGTGEMGWGGEGVPALEAVLEFPRGIVFWNGDLVFADIHNCVIRRIRCADGIIETIAGNRGWPQYHADGSITGYFRDQEEGVEAPDSGDGPDALSAYVGSPSALVVAPDGALIIAEWVQADDVENIGILRRLTSDGAITTLAGSWLFRDGDAADPLAAGFWGNIKGLAYDGTGNLFVGENDGRIRRIAPDGVVTTVLGADGKLGVSSGDVGRRAGDAHAAGTVGLLFRGDDLYYGDPGAGWIRYLEPAEPGGVIDAESIVRDVGSLAGLKMPYAIGIDGRGTMVVSTNWDARALIVDPLSGGASTLLNEANTIGDTIGATAAETLGSALNGIAFDEDDNAYVTDFQYGRLLRIEAITTDDDPVARVRPSSPVAEIARIPAIVADHVAVGGGQAWVSDPEQGNVWQVDIASGEVTRFAGNDLRDGSGVGLSAAEAALIVPVGVALHEGVLYVADPASSAVWTFDLAADRTDLIAIDSAFEDCPWCSGPDQLAITGGYLFVGDTAMNRILRIDLDDPHGRHDTIVGPFGSYDGLGWIEDGRPEGDTPMQPTGLAVGADGKLYVASNNMNRVLRIGSVDVLPGERDNVIDPSSETAIEVAILSRAGLDATALDPATVRVGAAVPTADGTSTRDVDGDGMDDLIVSVVQAEVDLAPRQKEIAVTITLGPDEVIRDADFVTTGARDER